MTSYEFGTLLAPRTCGVAARISTTALPAVAGPRLESIAVTQTSVPQRHSLYRRLIIALAALALVAVVVIIIFHPFRENNSVKGKVKVGYLPIAADLPLFVAAEQGYFSKRGIEVEMVRFESSPLMGTAFVNRDVDAVASIATTVALSTESRDPGRYRIFLVDANTPESPLSGILTMPATGVTAIEELKGKNVGIFPGSNAALVFGLVFEKHGLNSSP
jgi:ABC-type nitrate/sulfonate/bicarbonate transport system substrate-binding protein